MTVHEERIICVARYHKTFHAAINAVYHQNLLLANKRTLFKHSPWSLMDIKQHLQHWSLWSRMEDVWLRTSECAVFSVIFTVRSKVDDDYSILLSVQHSRVSRVKFNKDGARIVTKMLSRHKLTREERTTGLCTLIAARDINILWSMRQS